MPPKLELSNETVPRGGTAEAPNISHVGPGPGPRQPKLARERRETGGEKGREERGPEAKESGLNSLGVLFGPIPAGNQCTHHSTPTPSSGPCFCLAPLTRPNLAGGPQTFTLAPSARWPLPTPPLPNSRRAPFPPKLPADTDLAVRSPLLRFSQTPVLSTRSSGFAQSPRGEGAGRRKKREGEGQSWLPVPGSPKFRGRGGPWRAAGAVKKRSDWSYVMDGSKGLRARVLPLTHPDPSLRTSLSSCESAIPESV